jgi:hypothetical protein
MAGFVKGVIIGTWDTGALGTVAAGCAGRLVVSVAGGGVGAFGAAAGKVWAKPGWAAHAATRKQKHKMIRAAHLHTEEGS